MKFSGVSWTNDGKGFFYSRYDQPEGDTLKATNYFQKVYFHKLGTAQSDDVLVYERPDQKDWLFGGTVAADTAEGKRNVFGASTALCLIAAPEGIAMVERRSPATRIVAAAVDERLDDRMFIVPGLGDAGDRIFNTVGD